MTRRASRRDILAVIPQNERMLLGATLLMIVTLVLLGGAAPQPGLNMAAIFFSGILLLATLFFGAGFAVFRSIPTAVILVVLAPLLLTLAQLIPLPPEIWQAMPGQALRLQALGLIDLADSWQPISLMPIATTYSAMICLIFAGLVFALFALSERSSNIVILALATTVILSLAVGLVQFATQGVAFKFYQEAHDGPLIGFFANKNHMALIIACSNILFHYISRTIFRSSKIYLYLYLIFSSVAIVATNSRAGIILAAISIFMIFWQDFDKIRKIYFYIALVLFTLLAGFVMVSPTFDIVFERFFDSQNDVRWNFVINSLPIIKQYSLLGYGTGSFSTLYITQEAVQSLSPVYVNQLHNDYLQLFIEGGILGVLMLLGTAVAMFVAVRRGLRNEATRRLTWLGFSIILLFALHSILDYPLRRPAALVFFAVAFSYAFRPLVRRNG